MKQMKIAWIADTDDSNPYWSVEDTVRRKCEQEIDSWFRNEGVTIEIIVGGADHDFLQTVIDENYSIVIASQTWTSLSEFAARFDGVIVSLRQTVTAPNIIDMSSEIMWDQLVKLVASELRATKILMIGDPDFDSDYDRYGDDLRELGWDGSFSAFPLTKEEHDVFYEDEDEDDDEELTAKIRARLNDTLTALDQNSVVLVVSNTNYLFTHNVINFCVWGNDKIKHFVLDESFDLDNVEDSIFLASRRTNHFDHLIYLEEVSAEVSTSELTWDVQLLAQIEAQFDILYLIFYLRNYWLEYWLADDFPDFRDALIHGINILDGRVDIFERWGRLYAFQHNKLITQKKSIYWNIWNGYESRYDKILFEKQLTHTNDYQRVIYIDFQLYRVNHIDISDRFWIGEMYIDVNSPVANPIELLRFANRSRSNDLWSMQKIRERSVGGDRFQTKYHLVGAFFLKADLQSYPFDMQLIRMEYSLEKGSQENMLQPPELAMQVSHTLPEIDGWQFVGYHCGNQFKQERDHAGPKELMQMNISEKHILEWAFQRTNDVSLYRSCIPLLVLMVIAWYSSFGGTDVVIETIQINTTVFLAWVALYFSADKPKGSSFTFIDKMFFYFYLAIGLQILSEFTLMIGERLYEITHLVWQVGIPFGIAIFLEIVWRKVKDIRRIERESNG